MNDQLDPHTANVGFVYGDLGGGCFGRVYYWYDPYGDLVAVDDHDLRPQHPEIADDDWARLFYEAFDRGETEFVADLGATLPDAIGDLEAAGQASAIGRMFGPRPPRSSVDEIHGRSESASAEV
jgi:hypothetical protein